MKGPWADLEERRPTSTVPEFIGGVLFVLDGMISPLMNIPYSYLSVFALAALALTRRPTRKLERWGWVALLLVGVLVFVSVVSMMSQPTSLASPWLRRIVRLAGVALLTTALATGRLNIRAMIVGTTTGLVANAAAFYLHLVPDTYAGALTGFLGDKNRAGLFYATFGLLSLAVFRQRALQVLLVTGFAGLIWLTESRSSITAYTAGLIWFLVVAKRPLAIRWASAAGLLWLVTFVEENFAQAGVFQNRWGSDLLRGRIDAAADAKLALAPWFGMGLGEAYVFLQGSRWFFHNSYSSLLVEGGWVFLIVVLAITVIVGLRPFSPGEEHFDSRLTAGATVVLLICAWKLGEVFLTIPWAVTIGYALNRILVHEATKTDGELSVLEARDRV